LQHGGILSRKSRASNVSFLTEIFAQKKRIGQPRKIVFNAEP
jgi:hypothetical protein